MTVKLKVSFYGRLICVVTTILGILLFLIYVFLNMLFVLDLDYFDKYGFNRVSKNRYFNLCTKIQCDNMEIIYKSIFNILILNMFFLHHILFAFLKLKECLNYLFNYSVFERGLYILSNILSII
jgi:hypothetical protein